MKKTRWQIPLYTAAGLMLLFIALILAVKLIDVAPIGPFGSEIGLSGINGAVHGALKFNDTWYSISEYLGYIAIASALGFAVLGAVELVKRKSIKKVDKDIIALALFYVAVVGFYVLFELIAVNYRPVILEDGLEASFPSSHTMLAVALMGAAIYQLLTRVKKRFWCALSVSAAGVIALSVTLTRLLSGVHWLTDIIGGVLLSSALVLAYVGVCMLMESRSPSHE